MKPGLFRAFGGVIKIVATVPLLLAGIYFLGKLVVLPFYEEMRNPKKDGTVDRQAPTAVQILQQTRKVVAENNAKVAKVDDILNDLGHPVVATPPAGSSPPTIAVAPAARAPAAPVTNEQIQVQIQRVLDAMKILGVSGGPDPRAVVEGRLVKFGDIVEYRLGLRFVEVDEELHEVRFIDPQGTLYTRKY